MAFSIKHRAVGTIDEIETKLTSALKENGFGVLSRLEVDKILAEKIGVTIAPYRILGACNPRLAYESLKVEPEIGVFLPCSVCLREETDGTVSIWALDPSAVVEAIHQPDLTESGLQARALIEHALDSL